MVKKIPYQNLDHALKLFRGQVMEGVPYAQENIPQLNSPEKIFNWLKIRTRYKNDPKNTELFQTLPTLLDDNYHGLTGSGDCDCFTISALSVLLANGFTNCGIVLVGRSPLQPVHIYAFVIDNGERKFLDLTNKYYDQERNYPYRQYIDFKLTPKEKRNMTLQLAETSPYANAGYIYIPSQGVNMREDLFDDMPTGAFQKMLLSEGYEPHELMELSKGRGQRRANKQAKKDVKLDKKKAKVNRVNSTADKRRDKGTAKKTKAENKGKGKSWDETLTTVTDVAGNLIGKWKGTDRVNNDDDESVSVNQVTGEVYKNNTPPTKEKNLYYNIMGHEIKKSTVHWGGGLAGLALLYAGYQATHKRK